MAGSSHRGEKAFCSHRFVVGFRIPDYHTVALLGRAAIGKHYRLYIWHRDGHFRDSGILFVLCILRLLFGFCGLTKYADIDGGPGTWFMRWPDYDRIIEPCS